MIIHVVQPGETIYSIADYYDVSPIILIQENSITDPNNLVIGSSIVILYPETTHMVRPGDTVDSIANNYGISIMQLLRNNPHIADLGLRAGEVLVISYTDDKIREITTNGYSYPFIHSATLRKTLPFLTYLTVFYYQITEGANLVDIDDQNIIQLAKEYGVAPIMLISTMATDGSHDTDLSSTILNSEELQNSLIANALEILRSKGYYGLNINIPFVKPEDRDNFITLVERFSSILKQDGFELFITIYPTSLPHEIGINERNYYAALGQAADQTLLLSYEWATTANAPLGVTSYALIREYLDLAVTLIPSDKISIGIPTIGYIAQMPFIEGESRANSISIEFAIDLAREVDATIYFDYSTQTPFFQYSNDTSNLVWFKDARSIETLTQLVPFYGFNGVGLWNIMRFFTQMWLIINSQYDIKKIL
jgi:spore germination protein